MAPAIRAKRSRYGANDHRSCPLAARGPERHLLDHVRHRGVVLNAGFDRIASQRRAITCLRAPETFTNFPSVSANRAAPSAAVGRSDRRRRAAREREHDDRGKERSGTPMAIARRRRGRGKNARSGCGLQRKRVGRRSPNKVGTICWPSCLLRQRAIDSCRRLHP